MKIFFISLSCFIYCFCQAQQKESYTLNDLNRQRIETNHKGMRVLTGWGLLNAGSGIIGLLTTDNTEVKAFHTMNALWGMVNTGIGVLGILRAKKEGHLMLTDDQKYRAYKNVKRLYLINGGLDVLYMATGVVLHNKADGFKNPARGKGYGNSLIVQGAGLFLFDAAMYLSHQKQNPYWKQNTPKLAVTENGLGLVYHF